MGLFDKVGADAKREAEIKARITKLQAKLLNANSVETIEIKAEITQLKMLLAAAGQSSS